MAHLHKAKAGQWSKEKSIGIRDRMLVFIVVAAVLQGIVIGYCFARFTPAVAIVLLGYSQSCCG